MKSVWIECRRPEEKEESSILQLLMSRGKGLESSDVKKQYILHSHKRIKIVL